LALKVGLGVGCCVTDPVRVPVAADDGVLVWDGAMTLL